MAHIHYVVLNRYKRSAEQDNIIFDSLQSRTKRSNAIASLVLFQSRYTFTKLEHLLKSQRASVIAEDSTLLVIVDQRIEFSDIKRFGVMDAFGIKVTGTRYLQLLLGVLTMY